MTGLPPHSLFPAHINTPGDMWELRVLLKKNIKKEKQVTARLPKVIFIKGINAKQPSESRG